MVIRDNYSSYSAVKKVRNSIFKNREILNVDYIPNTINFRSKQLSLMISHSRSISDGYAPANMHLMGECSTGKTSTMLTYFQHIREKHNKIKTVYIECFTHKTAYKIYAKIYTALTDMEVKNGTQTTKLYNEIIKKIVNEKLILVVVLDEYNKMKNQKEVNEIFYGLLRAKETNPLAQIRIIATHSQNQVSCDYSLDKDVMTVYQPLTIEFPPYTIEELRSILKERTDRGLQKETITKELIKQIAWYTHAKGDLKYGIELLYRAAEQSEKKESTIIEEKHIIDTIQHHTQGGGGLDKTKIPAKN